MSVVEAAINRAIGKSHPASGSPTSNYGSATTLEVDNSPVKHFLLKFDVTGINSGQVTSAKLCLYNVNSANEGGDFYRVADNSWQEETVTWNNAPAADTNLVASLGSVSPNTWYEVDLTSHITADGTYSLRVSDSVGGADYSSKEGSNDPKLLVSVAGEPAQSCAPAATATPTSGPTNTATNTPTPGPSPTPTNTFTPTAITPPTATVPPPATFNNATFVYDGDGRRVKSTINSTTTTYFVGAHYEVTGSTITKYYYAGSQRIAMRTNGTLNYLLGDHLGSISLVTDVTGHSPIETRYKAWGETRYASGNILTQYQYTGQYSDSYINLLDYGPRRYDPELGRFIQPDSIVPTSVQGVQAYDRYAYVSNNPVRYNDPSGHCVGVITCTLTLFGVLGDVRGAILTVVLTDTNDATVTAGIAVQSQWLGPQDIPVLLNVYDRVTGADSNSHHYGLAQTNKEELGDYGLEQDPGDPSVAVQAMEKRRRLGRRFSDFPVLSPIDCPA